MLSYVFCLKLFLLLLSVFIIATIGISGGVYGVAYVTYLRNHSQIGEIDFVLKAWNLLYVVFIVAGYIACLVSTKFLLLSKFDVYTILQKKKQEEKRVINLPQK